MSPLVEAEIACPHCGETYMIVIDTTQGDHSMIEDCPVCCRPMTVRLQIDHDGSFSVDVTGEDA